ncbi:MAG: ABC transporter permease, partial [Gemmatimonadaceae bacterium]
YAARGIRRAPLFALVSVLSIAIGVGATTAIVTLANTLLFSAPPGTGDPDRIVVIGSTRNGQGFDNFSYPTFLDYRGAKSVPAMSAVQVETRDVSLGGPSGGEAIKATIVSGNFFSVLQTRPALGRFFVPDEDATPGGGANPAVVLSHRFWRTRFESDPSLIGRTIALNGSPFTVVGVATEEFNGPFVIAPHVWVTTMASTRVGMSEQLFRARNAVWIMGVGRLAPDVSLSEAQAELSGIAARARQLHPNMNQGHGVAVHPATLLPGQLRTVASAFMAMLFVIAALVLVIASTNVAGMLLARATARRREIAVRLAIGASRSRLISQLVTESLMLFAVAGVAGLLLAKWLVAGLLVLVPRLPVQLVVDARMAWPVFLFALGASVIAGVGAGLVPAIQASKPQLVPALKLGDAGGLARHQRLRGALLVAQITFSMLLLVVGGLMARALTKAQAIDPGFNPRGVVLASLNLELANYDSLRGRPFMSTLIERAEALPGARSAATAAMIPVDGGGLGLGGVQVAGRQPPEGGDGWDEDWNVVSPAYFETLQIPIVRGRAFTDADRTGRADVTILNETFARTLFPSEDAVGKVIRNGERTLTVIGIAKNGKYRTLGERPRNYIYVPISQWYFERLTLFVREDGNSQRRELGGGTWERDRGCGVDARDSASRGGARSRVADPAAQGAG